MNTNELKNSNDLLKKSLQEITAFMEYIKKNENTMDKISAKVCKSNIILMLYNLIESCSRSILIEIQTKIQQDVPRINDIRHNILNIIFQRGGVPSEELESLEIRNSDELILHIIGKKIFQGNINVRSINKIARQYGFSAISGDKIGNDIDTIKEKRNDLAHGNISFADLGRSYTLEDIERFKENSQIFLERFLESADLYLKNRGYLMATESD